MDVTEVPQNVVENVREWRNYLDPWVRYKRPNLYGALLEGLEKLGRIQILQAEEIHIEYKLKEGSTATKEVMLKMPAFRVPMIDPTGAGDAFCAGMIFGLIQFMRHKRLAISNLTIENLTQNLLEGQAAGAACVTTVGTTTAVARKKVDKLLREQGPAILERTLSQRRPKKF